MSGPHKPPVDKLDPSGFPPIPQAEEEKPPCPEIPPLRLCRETVRGFVSGTVFASLLAAETGPGYPSPDPPEREDLAVEARRLAEILVPDPEEG